MAVRAVERLGLAGVGVGRSVRMLVAVLVVQGEIYGMRVMKRIALCLLRLLSIHFLMELVEAGLVRLAKMPWAVMAVAVVN
ncbi:hypothetical protein WJ13_18415 [Burkholderia seminalis]|nr:hypothetical protein WJ13_18415 [Burkholderia seminalis]